MVSSILWDWSARRAVFTLPRAARIARNPTVAPAMSGYPRKGRRLGMIADRQLSGNGVGRE
jgi:hypothetical protein